LPADHKVSVGWQVACNFIPIADWWAFYRIRKLRKYLLFVFLPWSVTSFLYVYFVPKSLETSFVYLNTPQAIAYLIGYQIYKILLTQAVTLAFLAFAIYLVIIWSRQHNRQFSQSTSRSQPSDHR